MRFPGIETRIPLPEQLVEVLRAAKARAPLRFLALCLLLSCGTRSELETEREALFAIVTNGAVQHHHPCELVRRAEVSTRNGFLPEAQANAVHSRIGSADLGSVERCLAQVLAYNECFLELSCSAFTSDADQPVWLAGSRVTPCGCGVDYRGAAGPFAEPRFPEALSACVGLLPVTTFGPMPGVAMGSCVD